MEQGQAFLVTTEHRGVFFGYTDDPMPKDGVLTLRQARNCVYWSTDVKGFLGLASTGPSNSCKVGPPAPKLILMGVTSVAEVTTEAAEKWQKALWR